MATATKKPTKKKTTKKKSSPKKSEDKKKTISTKERVIIIEAYLKNKYNFRYNPISDRTEFKSVKAKE